MKRTAKSVWQGAGKDGKGTLTTPSGVLSETAYSYHTRFEDGKGTNPEELIAAAHAGCFNMALSFMLNGEGLTADRLETTANLTMENRNGGWDITTIHLDLRGKVPGIDQAKFQQIADKAKAGCPVSKVLKAEITMTATLES
jgi:osmotically inducible protein OsmC